MIDTQIAALKGAIISLAIDRKAKAIFSYSNEGGADIRVLDGGTIWQHDASSTEFVQSTISSLSGEAPVISSQYVEERLFLVVGDLFALKGGGKAAVVLFDSGCHSARELVRGHYVNGLSDPVEGSFGTVFVGLHDGVAAFKSPEYELRWVDGADGIDLDAQIGPDGVMYSPKCNKLIAFDSVVNRPDRIRVYSVDADGRALDKVEYQAEGRTEYRAGGEGDQCRGCSYNYLSNEIAYIMSQDEWVASCTPQIGHTVPLADLYVQQIDFPARRFTINGVVGKNVGYRRSDRNPHNPAPPDSYLLHQINTDGCRIFVVPVGFERYVLGIPGGTVCLLETRDGNQTTVCSFPSEITAMKLGLDFGSVLVGLRSGDLHLLQV
jgi:hypothetical protein